MDTSAIWRSSLWAAHTEQVSLAPGTWLVSLDISIEITYKISHESVVVTYNILLNNSIFYERKPLTSLIKVFEWGKSNKIDDN